MGTDIPAEERAATMVLRGPLDWPRAAWGPRRGAYQAYTCQIPGSRGAQQGDGSRSMFIKGNGGKRKHHLNSLALTYRMYREL